MSDKGPLLEADFSVTQGGLRLEVRFALTAAWTVLFGASGSGKTTALRAIQGFVRPQRGTILQASHVLVDREHGVFVEAHQRAVRSASQTPQLFAGMSVRENVLYGAGTGEAVEEVLRLLRVEGLASRRPDALSGGERQRVSVARAAAAAVALPGALLLLDEPFSGLDYGLRDELASALRAWLEERAVPVLSVTHDVGEAFLLGAEVLRLEGGRIVDQGLAERVLAAERERVVRVLGS